MPPFYRKPAGAIFDIKPVDDSGIIDVARIDSVEPVVNLGTHKPQKVSLKNETSNQQISVKNSHAEKIKEHPQSPVSHEIRSQFEELLNNETDLEVELAKIGAQAFYDHHAKPRYRTIQKPAVELEKVPQVENIESKIADPRLDAILLEIQRSSIASSYDSTEGTSSPVEPAATNSRVNFDPTFFKPELIKKTVTKKPQKVFHFPFSRRQLLIGVVVLLVLVGIIHYVVHVKHEVVQQSAVAVENLQSAHDDLKSLNFSGASQDFIDAYENFAKAGSSLNFMGAAITDIIAVLPGGSTVKSARNLLQVGQLLADAGSAMTSAMDAVAKTGSIFDPTNNKIAIGSIVGKLQKALLISKQNVVKASSLIADIDASIIPPDKQEQFNEFKSNLPLFKDTISQSADYAKFFENLIDVSGSKRYLLLFENPSELRPVGGFPGTYGVVTFKDGKLENFFVDDVYNLDGQLKEHIIPPLQMQHITPTWGMRDANWFIDFPTSARKIEEFYKKESGQSIDGVIVINPKLVASILEIVGPVEMPEYNLTLDAKNILVTIQDEVEYGKNRTQPKQIVKDFAPKLLEKIYSASSDQWLAIFNKLVAGIDERKMLMYFNSLNLESFATDKGFGGQVKKVTGDYMMATITNIKGSKTDAVTDTSFAIDTTFETSDAIHTLTIIRQHNGGSSKFGFYNKQNPAYVRVLVPAGAELISIEGNDNPNFGKLVDYNSGDFKKDEDLVTFETSGHTDKTTGVITYQEAGKDEFGFWMIVDPGKTKTVTLTYRVPNALTGKTYDLYVQKQPGLEVKNFSLSVSEPTGMKATAAYPTLESSDDGYSWSGEFIKDLPVKVEFQ